MEHLCRATDAGHEWPVACPVVRPSSGLLAVVWALQAYAWLGEGVGLGFGFGFGFGLGLGLGIGIGFG